MTETARADATPIGDDAVAGIGATLSAVTLAAVLVPIRRGLEDPVVWGAATFAVVAVLAFLASRHGVDRRLAAVLAACSNVGVVLLSGYALNQGSAGSISVPGLEWSLSLVFTAFLTAGLAAGIAAANYYGIGLGGLKDRSLQTVLLAVVGFAGLLAAQIAALLLFLPVTALYAPLEAIGDTERIVVSQFGTAIGMGGLALGYLAVMEYDRSYIDLRVPSKRDVLWIVGGLIVIFGTLFAISMLFQVIGVESTEHGTTEQAEENPAILLVLIPAALLIIGPFEELLYRNVIQKSLYGVFSRFGAVVVSSVIFALVHAPAYGGNGPGPEGVTASLGMVFGLSIVLGTVYERTENLVVPALIHGIFNAIQFATLYLTYA